MNQLGAEKSSWECVEELAERLQPGPHVLRARFGHWRGFSQSSHHLCCERTWATARWKDSSIPVPRGCGATPGQCWPTLVPCGLSAGAEASVYVHVGHKKKEMVWAEHDHTEVFPQSCSEGALRSPCSSLRRSVGDVQANSQGRGWCCY